MHVFNGVYRRCIQLIKVCSCEEDQSRLRQWYLIPLFIFRTKRGHAWWEAACWFWVLTTGRGAFLGENKDRTGGTRVCAGKRHAEETIFHMANWSVRVDRLLIVNSTPCMYQKLATFYSTWLHTRTHLTNVFWDYCDTPSSWLSKQAKPDIVCAIGYKSACSYYPQGICTESYYF
jgi:hypothetical protein